MSSLNDSLHYQISSDIRTGIEQLFGLNSSIQNDTENDTQNSEAPSSNKEKPAPESSTARKLNNTLLDNAQLDKVSADLARFVAELMRWNKAFNLTAITQLDDIITHHILDSLSLHPYITGQSILDVGTGAGLPGVPLAILNPDKTFVLVDSNNKKLKFIRQVAGLLGLNNLSAVHCRIEHLNEGQFDIVTSRAFASMKDFVTLAGMHCKSNGKMLAMKGLTPDQEITELPANWHVENIAPLTVPKLEAARCVVTITQQAV